MQRFLDPEGLQSARHRPFRRLGRHLRRGRRDDGNLPRRQDAEAPQPLRQVRQPARTAADVPLVRRRADGRDAEPAPAEAGRRQAARRRLPDVRRAARAPAGAGGALRAAPLAEGRSAGGQRPGHHHRRPQARPRRPDALGRRRRTSPARRSTPWSRTSPRIWQRTAATARHADDLLRHGRASRRRGASRPTTRSSTSWSPAASPASRSPPSATPTPTPRSRPCSRRSAAARSAC